MPDRSRDHLWELLEQIALSGQMTDADLQERMRGDPEFAAWMRARVAMRRTQHLHRRSI